jgi:hypothetical protein
LEAFNAEPRSQDGRRSDCRECQNDAARSIYHMQYVHDSAEA